jgi:hypothetical protein
MGLWLRIAARYLIGGMAGLLAYAGMPADVIDVIRQDPEIVTGVTLALVATVEWVTVEARKRGWLT